MTGGPGGLDAIGNARFHWSIIYERPEITQTFKNKEQATMANSVDATYTCPYNTGRHTHPLQEDKERLLHFLK